MVEAAGSRPASLLLPLAISLSFVGCAGSAPDSVDLCPYGREFCDLESYSGFLPVARGGSLFYWYFVPPNASGAEPLILWLQGGPGASSMAGVFFEMGPVALDKDARLRRRDATETWASEFPLLFVDSPVGTGWSFPGVAGYATNEDEVAGDLISFLGAFASRHPEAPRRLVVAGESYGGHYVPALAAALLAGAGGTGAPRLQAVAIGDSFLDPPTQVLTKPRQAFAFGMLDERQLRQAEEMASQAHDLALNGSFVQAAEVRYAMEDLVTNASRLNLHDVRTTESYDWMDERLRRFFSLNTTKDTLHIPRERSFGTDAGVKASLMGDVMRSQKHNVERLLLGGVRALFYQGQFDFKDGTTSNEAWISSMQWPGAAGYSQASRLIWRRAADEQIAGYWRRHENLEEVVVLSAGHLVPMNQPKSALDMIRRFIWERQPAPAGGPGRAEATAAARVELV